MEIKNAHYYKTLNTVSKTDMLIQILFRIYEI